MIKGLDEKIVKSYYEYMVDMSVIFGADRSRAERELLDSLNFEIALANVNAIVHLNNRKSNFQFSSVQYLYRFRCQTKNDATRPHYTIRWHYEMYKKSIHIFRG